MTRRPRHPANDNAPPAGRQTISEIPAELPLFEAELALVENCFGEIIGRMLASIAIGAEASADQEAKP